MKDREVLEYEVVWTPSRNAPSLLSDYPRQSSLSDLAADSKTTLRHRHKADRIKNQSRAYGAQTRTYDAARRYIRMVNGR